jgi:hypothetical protein
MSGSVVIIVCNICLHLSTRAIGMSSTNNRGTSVPLYGRELSSNCFPTISDTRSSFELDLGNDGCEGRMDLIVGGNDGYLTAKGQSTTNKVVTLDYSGLPGFYNESISILVDASAAPSPSYIASTYGVSTYFVDIGADCQINGTSNSWNCSDHKFDGLVTQPVTIPAATDLLLMSNVVKWALATKVYAGDGTFAHFDNNPNVAVSDRNNSLFTVMHCETTVYAVEYLKIGEKYIPQSVTPANDSVARLILGPVFPGTRFCSYRRQH